MAKNELIERIKATWAFFLASKTAAFTVVGGKEDVVICLKQHPNGTVGFSMVYDAIHVDELENSYSPALGLGLDAKMLFRSPDRRAISREMTNAEVAREGLDACVDTADETFGTPPKKEQLH